MSNPNNPFARLDRSELYDNLINVISDLSDLAGHNALFAVIEALRDAETAADRNTLVEAALTAATRANAQTIRVAVETVGHVLGQLAAYEVKPPDAA